MPVQDLPGMYFEVKLISVGFPWFLLNDRSTWSAGIGSAWCENSQTHWTQRT